MKTRASLFAALLSVYILMACHRNDDAAETGPVGPVTIADTILTSSLVFPWEIAWGPDNNIWITERGGKISRMDPATSAITPVFTVPDIVATGEGGLLGMALSGEANAMQVYIVYNYNEAGYKEKVVRYHYNGTTLTDPVVIIDNIPASNIHNGSRLLIVGDKLFISTGDASQSSNAQNTSSLSGKILRLNPDGSIPADNPLPGNPYWSFGHRNPQGLVFANDKLYSSEHGPSADDEINIITKGSNYGWPNIEGLCNTSDEQIFCAANNVVEPIRTWTPTTAPSGLEWYNHDAIPQWKGSLLLTALKDTRLYQLKLNTSSDAVESVTEFYNGKYGRLRDLCISPAGVVYACTSNGSNDMIIRISGVEE